MTSADKAVKTRRKNKEKRDQRRRNQKEAKEKMERALVEVLDSPLATIDQKLEASSLLNGLMR